MITKNQRITIAIAILATVLTIAVSFALLGNRPKSYNGLPIEKRKQISRDYIFANILASDIGAYLYPDEWYNQLAPGHAIRLAKETRLSPVLDAERSLQMEWTTGPKDAIAIVQEVRFQDMRWPWLKLNVIDPYGNTISQGWTLALNLNSDDVSWAQVAQQSRMFEELWPILQAEVAIKYNLSIQDLKKITTEGQRANWEWPSSPTKPEIIQAAKIHTRQKPYLPVLE